MTKILVTAAVACALTGLIGYLLLWKHRGGQYLLIDYLCVPARLRGCGIGKPHGTDTPVVFARCVCAVIAL